MTYDGTDVITGFQTAHLASIESTYGTRGTATGWMGNLTRFTVGRIDELFLRKGLVSNRDSYSGATLIRSFYEGTIEGELNSGYPIALALGNISATTDPTCYTLQSSGHATPTKDYLPSFSLTVEDTDAVRYGVKGATVRSLTLNYRLNEPLRFTLDYRAQAADTDDITAATDPGEVYGSWNSKLQIDAANATFTSGTDISGVTEYSMTINENPIGEDEPEWNGTTLRQSKLGVPEHTLTLTRYTQDQDLWGLAADSSTLSFRLYSYIDASHYIYLDLQGANITSPGKVTEFPEKDVVRETVTVTCKYLKATILDDETYIIWD